MALFVFRLEGAAIQVPDDGDPSAGAAPWVVVMSASSLCKGLGRRRYAGRKVPNLLTAWPFDGKAR